MTKYAECLYFCFDKVSQIVYNSCIVMENYDIHGRCPLCGKAYKDPLLFSHACNDSDIETAIPDEDHYQPSYGQRLEDGFAMINGENQ